ncbi:MAG: TadE/TadG family type IV pilus assembly protein, partial [Myxococcales bacterium]
MSRRTMRRLMKSDEGQATVEFALSMLVMVPTLLYAIFFYEVCLAKLKANEAGRYMVWEMTAMGLSDWKTANHDQRYSQAQNQLVGEVNSRYGDDLDGATGPANIAPVTTVKAGKPMMIKVSFSSQLQNVDPQIFTVANVSAGDAVAQAVFNQAKFNTKGKVKGDFVANIENVWLKKMKSMAWQRNKVLDTNLTIKSSHSIIADQWDLKDGSDVRHDSVTGGCQGKDYCTQVARMVFAGLSQVGGGNNSQSDFDGAMGGVGKLLGGIGVHYPFAATVASLRMTGSTDSAHRLDVARIPKHTPLCKHYTNVFKDMQSQNNSELYKLYTRLGGNYMGCRDELTREGDCAY